MSRKLSASTTLVVLTWHAVSSFRTSRNIRNESCGGKVWSRMDKVRGLGSGATKQSRIRLHVEGPPQLLGPVSRPVSGSNSETAFRCASRAEAWLHLFSHASK